MTKEESQQIVKSLFYAADCIRYYETDCGKKNICEYVPQPGQIARINCPLWEEKGEQK